jgi:hypothetical protein
MYGQLFSHTSLLTLPLIAMFVFLGVFLTVTARTLLRRAHAFAEVARLPVEEENDHG